MTLVKAAPYHGTLQNTNYQIHSDSPAWDFFSGGHATRFMQSGLVEQVKFYIQYKENITDFRIKTWSENENTKMCNLRSTTANLASRLVNGLNTIDLSTTPLPVSEGDAYSVYIAGTWDAGKPNLAVSSSDASYHACVRYARSPSATNMNWIDQSGYDGSISIEFYMDAPDALYIGDSIMSGHVNSFAFTDQSAAATNANYWMITPYKIQALLGWSYQNVGISGDTYPNLYNRFAVDVIAKNPAVAVIETGVNSLANNMEPAAIFAYVQQSILDCQAANILPIVILVTPAYGHLTSTQNLKADTLNNLIIAYKQTNPNFVITDPRASLGTYNSSTGWTLRHEYSCDAGPTAYVHLNEAGHRILAQSIYKAYTNYLIPVPTTGVSFGGTTLGVWQENKIHYSVPSDETCLLSGNVNAQISSRAPTFPRSFECYTYSYTEIDALGAKIGTFDTLVINGEIYPDCYIYSFGNIHEIVYGSGKYTYSISFGHADSHA